MKSFIASAIFAVASAKNYAYSTEYAQYAADGYGYAYKSDYKYAPSQYTYTSEYSGDY